VDYDKIFSQAIDRLHAEGRYRVFIDILRNKGSFPNARCFAHHNGPQPVTVWCSNDYLAMGQHPDVIVAMEEALHDVGAGSGGTRNIGGNTHYHIQLERELADWHSKSGALLFTSGYVSNEATLSTLTKILPGCIIFSDELNHASMIAGIKNSGCEKRVFRHNDLDHLEELLAGRLRHFLQNTFPSAALQGSGGQITGRPNTRTTGQRRSNAGFHVAANAQLSAKCRGAECPDTLGNACGEGTASK